MNDTGCQNEQGAPGHVMIECLKRIIHEYLNLEPPGGLLPRRVAIGSLPGKVSVVTGVRGSGKTTLLCQRIRQLIESGVPRENILYLDLADDRLYWLRHENPDQILEAWFELHTQTRGSETVHCFFDEVQALPHWQLFIDRLMRTEKCEVTVAGSLLTSPEEDTASPLTGRTVSWEIFPLSFLEFLDGKGIESDGPLSTKQRLTIQKALLRRMTPEIFYHKTKSGREVDLVALLPSAPGQERAVMLVQVCASLADPRVKQSEVRSLSEAMVELGVTEGTIVTWHTDETIPVGFGTIHVVPVWRFLLKMPKIEDSG